jgi:tRNA-splicing ligase RtcB (3'-phosphate/5'-hydroxy nucleic acid ligase)
MRVGVPPGRVEGRALENHEPDSTGVRIFASDLAPADGEGVAHIETAAPADIAAPPVVLPDFHHKGDLEMPSSIAIATRETINPSFTSSSLNCGMALIALDAAPPDRRAIERFYDVVRNRYPHPPRSRPELTVDEVRQTAIDGAEFAIHRFDADGADLERIEHDGRLNLEPYGGRPALRRAVPRLAIELSRLRFGTVGPSNHFIELQVVEDVLDDHAASVLGVRAGQLVLQYHAGGGVLTGQVGRLFARRKKASKALRVEMALQKPIFHLSRSRSINEARRRFRLFFDPSCPPISRWSSEGRQVMLANAAAMNYAFAFRLATYASLRRAAARTLGATGSRLVVDSPHNSIYEEDVGGSSALVHRHNSCRAYPASMMPAGTAFGTVGQALLLPGTNRTSSYLCVAGGRAEQSLYSACHGAGTMISDFVTRGLSREDSRGGRTLRFRYSDAAPEEIPHLDDLGVNEALSVLSSNELVRPVARMRPLAVLT